jgi:predicted glutamate--cysteine ligase
LVALTDANELAAAHSSLEAALTHWQDGRTLLARDWIEELYAEVWPTAKQQGFSCFLSPITRILSQGNEAQRWLKAHAAGQTIADILGQAIAQAEVQEQDLKDKLCEPLPSFGG